jgi:phage terminase large subunit-like protein
MTAMRKRRATTGPLPKLDPASLARWHADPVLFIEQVLVNPETGRPFELFEAQRRFFAHAWWLDAAGRLLYPEQVFGAPKKTGKTATSAMHLITTCLLFGDRFAEGYALANDLEQAQGRVFQAVRRIVEASPLLRAEANVLQQRVEFPRFGGAVIQAIGSDYASAAGANPVISSFDELWAFTSERSRRLWDEMIPSPARRVSLRFVSTYAGFSGESVLLEELYQRGKAQPEIAPGLHAGDGILMAWHHEPVAPWQTEAWLAEMRRSLRPNQYLRMIECRFVTTESSFIDLADWDACTDPTVRPLLIDRQLPVWVGVDASVKRDSTAVVACAWDRSVNKVRLIYHKVFQPSRESPLDFEATIEATIIELHARFRLQQCRFDPFQMQSTAQRLLKRGIRMVEYPQTPANLTDASQNLFELIKGRNLIAYADDGIRLAIQRAVAVETGRGWRIAKEKQSHKIDVVIALGMAALGAVEGIAAQPLVISPQVARRIRAEKALATLMRRRAI